MIVLDTSFLVAFFNEYDVLHERAISDMKEIEPRAQLISNFVILETATVLKNRINLGMASKFLRGIKNKANLEIHTFSAEEFEDISQIFIAQRNSIGFIDASVIYLATQAIDAKVATYDENILREVSRRTV